MSEPKASDEDARALLYQAYDGVLSTHSVDVPGYPFGSVMPYCLDRTGCPVILIANIAQHTKNIVNDPRVSLIVLDRSVADLQANGRVTVLANAIPLPASESAAPARYYRYFPESRDYHKTHGFDFYRLEPVRIRYIGGFGKIFWLAPTSFVLANPFTDDEEAGMVDHMNADHADALRKYCADAGISVPDGAAVSMAGIDATGFHVRLDDRLVRFGFPNPVATPGEVRKALVAMARAPEH